MTKKASEIVSPAVTQSAAYGKQILATVSRELTEEFRGGFGYATVNRAFSLPSSSPIRRLCRRCRHNRRFVRRRGVPPMESRFLRHCRKN